MRLLLLRGPLQREKPSFKPFGSQQYRLSITFIYRQIILNGQLRPILYRQIILNSQLRPILWRHSNGQCILEAFQKNEWM